MGFHGGGWFALVRSDENERPEVTWALLRRVFEYARPYYWHIGLLLGTILLTAVLGLLTR
jgi:hypothetical protein